jgi:hypothetical protein
MTSKTGFMSARSQLLVLGGLSCWVYVGIAWLSSAFVYGEGHLRRPIPSFLLLYALAFLLYVVAFRLLRGPSRRADVWWVLAFAVIFRVSLLCSHPIQEDDFYRYLWDGKVVASGLNPYQVTPLAVRNHRGDDTLRPYARILAADPSFTLILSRVNHPAVPTIYPPFAQAVFALAALAAPGSLVALRIIFLSFDLGICGLVIATLARLRLSPLCVLVYAWSPLVIKESINSAHYDTVPTFFLLLGQVLALAHKPVLAHASLAVAVLGKVYPLLVLPLFFWRTWITRGRTPAFLGLGTFAVVLGLGYAPFLAAGPWVWEGTVTFAERWETNSLLFPLLRALTGERWLANIIVGLALAAVTLIILRRVDVRHERAFVWANFCVLGALFLLSPVGNPWYFLWLMPFLCCFPLRSWLLLSGLLGLYYLSFYFIYRGAADAFRWVIWVEYGPFYALLLWEVLTQRTRCSPSRQKEDAQRRCG